MDDKTLTELAAKAAGYQVVGLARKYIVQGVSDIALLFLNERGGDSVFDPLNDDGDALRLAVKLGMQIHINYDPAGFSAIAVLQSTAKGARTFVETDGDDPCASSRRAITKAAAAILGQEGIRNRIDAFLGRTEAIAEDGADAAEAKPDLAAAYDKLRATFHVTMLRLMPEKSHAEISAEIDRVAGLPAPVDAQPNMVDAYVGARDDLAIWKKRALEAEESCRRLTAELNEENGPTHMGEPVLSQITQIDIELMRQALHALDNSSIPFIGKLKDALRNRLGARLCSDKNCCYFGKTQPMNCGFYGCEKCDVK